MVEFETISSRDLDDYIHDSKSVIIDLRTKRKYIKSHIKNAVHIPYERIKNSYESLPINKEIILYCDRGSSSLIVAKWLSEKGYRTKTVVGGFYSYRGSNKVYNTPENKDFL